MGESARKSVHFAFVVHDHQPVGNFDHVIREAYERAYRPFLDVLERHPEMPFGLHTSGPLLDWLLQNEPGYVQRLRRLVESGQLEALTGGYYEPILPALTDEDKQGQIEMLTRAIADRLGARPRGLWLTERVWEPGLVRPLAAAGVDYTIVDDTHFEAAGFARKALRGYYLTEDQGAQIAIFPIDKRMRYLVPFEDPEKSLAHLRAIGEEAPGSLVVLADDGEKFGVWPETHALAYGERWLERWVELLLENRDWLGLTTCGAYLENARSLGVAYLPTASYAEMGEWSLPSEAQLEFKQAEAALTEEGRETPRSRFLRGGFWRHFLVKYPEANHMQKRVAAAAARARALGEERLLETLWAAQCNCAYWHGVFGGLYLPHLRDAVTTRLITAERELARRRHGDRAFLEVSVEDVDLDGAEEWRLENRELVVLVAPHSGGAVIELDDRRTGASLVNTLARRPEPFHARLVDEESDADEASGAHSIHDALRQKEDGLGKLLHYDAGRRLLGVEHLLLPGEDLESLWHALARQIADLSTVGYVPTLHRESDRVRLELRGVASLEEGGEIVLDKTWTLWRDGSGLELRLGLELSGTETVLEARLCSEWNLALLAGRAHDRYYRLPGVAGEECQLASAGVVLRVDHVGLTDAWRGLDVDLVLSREATLWRFPIETVSLSEAGAERVYQCSAVVPVWDLTLRPAERQELTVRLELAPVRAPSATT